ncbi:hypothetical protein LguiA_017454 [Lonicera macranthoides]
MALPFERQWEYLHDHKQMQKTGRAFGISVQQHCWTWEGWGERVGRLQGEIGRVAHRHTNRNGGVSAQEERLGRDESNKDISISQRGRLVMELGFDKDKRKEYSAPNDQYPMSKHVLFQVLAFVSYSIPNPFDFLISLCEADKRGKINDRVDSSFLFNLNEKSRIEHELKFGNSNIPQSSHVLDELPTILNTILGSDFTICLLQFFSPLAKVKDDQENGPLLRLSKRVNLVGEDTHLNTGEILNSNLTGRCLR